MGYSSYTAEFKIECVRRYFSPPRISARLLALEKGVPRLFTDLAMAKDTLDYRKAMNSLKKTEVLVLDDFGMSPMSLDETKDFLEIIEDRYRASSTIILSQLPVSDWYQVFKDRTYADAIMDRLFSSSSRIEVKGDSPRRE